jgi:aryl-alcohol dehydrogenase-like predicted oxidoreductase
MKYFQDGGPNPQWLERVHAVIEIPGFRTQAQLVESCRALEFGPLTAEQLAEIDAHLAR